MLLKKIIFLLFVFQVSLPASVSQTHFQLEVEIHGLRSEKGRMYFQLFDAEGKVIREDISQITDRVYRLKLEKLPTGRYAFRYYHDENENHKLDKSILGFPREGFGFSNDPPLLIGEPSFDKWLFQVGANTRMTSVIRYL